MKHGASWVKTAAQKKMPDLIVFFFLIVPRDRKPTEWMLLHIMADLL